MSTGPSEEIQSLSSQNAKSALISTGICLAALAAFYFLYGKQARQTAKTTEAVRVQQESAEELINQNSSHVEGIRQQLESLRSSLAENDNRQLNVEEFRQRLIQIEQSFSTLPRRAGETRAEIDAASSRNALQHAERLAVISLADQCEQALLTMRESTVTWGKEYEPLLTNDRGRQIAADKKAVQQFATAVRGHFPVVKGSIDRTAEFQAAVRPLREAVAKGNDNYPVTAADRVFFESLLSRIHDINRQLERRQRAVDVILATASQNDSGQLTLQKSIEQLESQSVLTMIAEATRVQKQKLKTAIDEQSEIILKAQKERIAAETQLRVQQEKVVAQEAIRNTEGLAKDEALAHAKAQRKKLEKEFLLEQKEIQSLLGAFINKGSYAPARDFSLDSPTMLVMNNSGSMSLGRLASIGALDQTKEGYELLYAVGGHRSNDRLRSGFPTYTFRGMANLTIVAKLKRASELLTKYGEILVEKRMITR